MRSPTMPRNGRDPGLIQDHPYVADAVGPENDQAALGAARFLGGITQAPVTQGRPVGSTVDVRSPQQFRNRVLEEAVSTTAVGDETAMESLPGRLRASAWDGEPGWAAAIGGV